MEEIVVQIGPRNGQQTRYQKFGGQSVRIGRSYTSDLIVNDPYIAAEQVHLRRAEGQWYLEVIDQTNPVFINGKPTRLLKTPIKSGDQIHIGRTTITVFSTAHDIEPARKLFFSNWFYRSAWRPFIPWIVLALVALGVGISEYLDSYDEINWEDIVSSALAGVLVLFLWAAVWSIIGRVIRHQPQFYIQLTLTGLVYLLAILIEFILGPMEYLSNSYFLSDVYHWLFALLILSLLLNVNLSVASNIRRPHRVAVVISAATLLFLFGMYKLDEEEFQWQPKYPQSLEPPMLKWRSDSQLDDYVDGYQTLFDQLQKQREVD